MNTTVTLNKPFRVHYPTAKWDVFRISLAVVIKQTEKAVLISFEKDKYNDGVFTIQGGPNNGITLKGRAEWTKEHTELWIPKSQFCNLDRWMVEKVFIGEERDEDGHLYPVFQVKKCYSL